MITDNITNNNMIAVFPPNNLKDKDKEKDAFIGLKEFVSHMMMA